MEQQTTIILTSVRKELEDRLKEIAGCETGDREKLEIKSLPLEEMQRFVADVSMDSGDKAQALVLVTEIANIQEEDLVVLKKLKESMGESLRKGLIFVLTDSYQDELHQQAEQAGADYIMRNPVDPALLLRRIDQFLHSKM